MNGNSLGHAVNDGAIIEGWRFKRCMCGFVLMLTPTGRIWWLRAIASPKEITSMAELLGALATDCKYRRRRPDGDGPPVASDKPQSEAKPRPLPQPDPEPPPTPHVEPPLPPTLRKLQMRGRPTVIVKPKAKKAK